MISKDDFDYYKLKNLPDDKAKVRRKVFNEILKGKNSSTGLMNSRKKMETEKSFKGH